MTSKTHIEEEEEETFKWSHQHLDKEEGNAHKRRPKTTKTTKRPDPFRILLTDEDILALFRGLNHVA